MNRIGTDGISLAFQTQGGLHEEGEPSTEDGHAI